MTKDQFLALARAAGFLYYDMTNVDGVDLGETLETDKAGALDRLVASLNELDAEMLTILEHDETSAETVSMMKRHHDLVQRLRGRVANKPSKETP